MTGCESLWRCVIRGLLLRSAALQREGNQQEGDGKQEGEAGVLRQGVYTRNADGGSEEEAEDNSKGVACTLTSGEIAVAVPGDERFNG